MNFTIDEILKILPHRYPFLLIDSVKDIVPGEKATGIKNITINEPYFSGHFPSNPIVPGVIIIETIAQTTAIMYASKFLNSNKNSTENISEKIGYLIEVKNMKFRNIVKPGDQLIIHVTKDITLGNLICVKAKVMVDNKVFVDGKIMVSQKGEK